MPLEPGATFERYKIHELIVGTRPAFTRADYERFIQPRPDR